MVAVNKEKDFIVPKTIAEFHQIESESKLPAFKGEIQVHDSFFTKKIISLNATVETSFCKEQNKYLMFFKVSTLDFKNLIWNELNAIILTSNICEK